MMRVPPGLTGALDILDFVIDENNRMRSKIALYPLCNSVKILRIRFFETNLT